MGRRIHVIWGGGYMSYGAFYPALEPYLPPSPSLFLSPPLSGQENTDDMMTVIMYYVDLLSSASAVS
jgi:hypothetical protein